jgi:site-specific DNA-cytosine methylase
VNGYVVQSDPPSRTDIKQMLGNAVAPPLAECIGRAIIDHSLGRKPEARASKALREGTGDSVEKNQERFKVPDRYRAWLEARRSLKPKALSQELSNLRRAKREVAAWELGSARDEMGALEKVLAVSLPSLNDGMKSSLRRALGEFADWEDQEIEKKTLRKRQRQQALRAQEDEEHQARELEESQSRPKPRFITEGRRWAENVATSVGHGSDASPASSVADSS